MELRPYQDLSIKELRNLFGLGYKRLVLCSGTGSGKSVMMMAMILSLVEKGKRCIFLCERRILVDQFARHLDKAGIDFGVKMAGHWRNRPYAQVQICSIQTLERIGEWPEADCIFADECFTGDTLVSTPSGSLPIKLVRSGDKVYTASGIGTVLQTMVRPATEIYKLEFDDGTVIQCTGNHPIFTARGWVRANELGVGEISFSEQGVLNLWKTVFPTNQDSGWEGDCGHWREEMGSAKDLLETLFSEIPSSWGVGENGAFAKEMLHELRSGVWPENKNCSRGNNYGNSKGHMGETEVLQQKVRDYSGEPYEQPPNNEKSGCETERDQAQTDTSRWQRAVASIATACLASCIGRGMGVGSVSPDKVKKHRLKLSNLLQNRYSEQGKNDWDRSGRTVSQYDSEASSRCEKDRIFGIARLVNISVEQRESSTPVYNLHVSGHPSYFANGRLVHNCHAMLRKSVIDYIEKHPNVKWVGATATPFHPSLGVYFERIVNVTTMSKLVEEKFLVPFNVFVSKEVDTEGLKVTAGEWQKDELEKRALTIIGDVVSDYIRIKHEVFGERKIKAICFSAGVAHGGELVKKFAEVGINAIQLSYKDSEQFKQDVIADFGKPDTEIDMLISSDLLTRGFDVVDIEHVILARPLRKSFSTFVQMVGRGARIAPGKTQCCIQCNSGNWLRFEEDWNELYYNGVDKLQDADTKKRKEKTKKEKENSICPKCYKLWAGGTICPHCGHEKKRRDMSEAVPGQLINIGKTKFTMTPESYWQQCMHMEQTAGWKRSQSMALLKEWFGVWPNNKWSSTPKPPDEHFQKIQAENKRKYIAGLKQANWKAKNLGPKLGSFPTK